MVWEPEGREPGKRLPQLIHWSRLWIPHLPVKKTHPPCHHPTLKKRCLRPLKQSSKAIQGKNQWVQSQLSRTTSWRKKVRFTWLLKVSLFKKNQFHSYSDTSQRFQLSSNIYIAPRNEFFSPMNFQSNPVVSKIGTFGTNVSIYDTNSY
jgi:hypothetical protein